MFRATPFFMPLFLSLIAAAEPAVLRVPGDHPTLAAAVEAAAPGDTVSLAPGNHLQTTPLLISKPLRIQGESAETTRIQTATLQDELIKVDGVDGFFMAGAALEYTGTPPPEGRTDFPSLLSVFGGRAEVEKCAFLSSTGFGVIFKQGANGAIRGCRVEDSICTGIYVKEAGTSVTVTDNDVNKNKEYGIIIYEDAAATVEGNRCRDNAEDGILVTRCRPAAVVVHGNTCTGNRENGILASFESKVRITDNICRDNTLAGVAVGTGSTGTVSGNTCEGGQGGVSISSSGTDVLVENNRCTKSRLAGVGVYYGGKATIKGNTCMENPGAGVWVSHWESSAEIHENNCTANNNSGILIDQGAHAEVRGNTCKGNGDYGVLASDEETRAEIGENLAEENAKGGIGTVEGVSGRYQYQVRTFEIGAAFLRERHEYLDNVAARLRKHRSRYYDGGWQLYHYYDGLLESNSELNLNKRPDFRIALEKWAGAHPDSITPRIALAMAHKEYAWVSRGSDWAYKVTPEGWKGFREHLEKAEKWCLEAESKPDKDPYLYATWLTIGMGQSTSNKEMMELLNRGMAIDPECYALYPAMCMSLWPRWGGSEKLVSQFFSVIHARTKEQYGEKMYVFAVDSQFCPGAVYGTLADWSLLQPGYDQILEEFPNSTYYLNRYCLMACVFGDKEKAGELFGRIGDNPDYNAWVYKQENFTGGRQWALHDGPLPDFFKVDKKPGDEEETPGRIRSMLNLVGL